MNMLVCVHDLPIGGYITLTWGVDLYSLPHLDYIGFCDRSRLVHANLIISYPLPSRDTINEYVMLRHGLQKKQNCIYIEGNMPCSGNLKKLKPHEYIPEIDFVTRRFYNPESDVIKVPSTIFISPMGK